MREGPVLYKFPSRRFRRSRIDNFPQDYQNRAKYGRMTKAGQAAHANVTAD
jgi:hypothetical protein